MASHPLARCRTRIVLGAAIVVVLLGVHARTTWPDDEPTYSVTVVSSNRSRTVLRIAVHRDADAQALHLLPYEDPPLNPRRRLPDARQESIVLGDAVFARVPSPEPGMLCFVKAGDAPSIGAGTYDVALDWIYPDDAEIETIGVAVALTSSRDATKWTAADVVGGRVVRLGPTHRIPALVPRTSEESPGPGGTPSRSDFYTLSAAPGLEADAAALRAALDRGIEAFRKQFAPLDVDALLSKATVTIRLHAEPTPRAGVGTATTRTGTRDGTAETYYASVDMLAPSAHPAGVTTRAGEPMDLAYSKRILVHEVGTVLLDLVCRCKGGGWQFFDAPEWFVQGYEEYLGLTYADERAGPVTLGRYVAAVAAHPEWISFDFGFDVTEPYVAGPVLLHFMHERYGGAKVRAVLTSREPTFGRAMRRALGVDLDGFRDDWKAWLEEPSPAR